MLCYAGNKKHLSFIIVLVWLTLPRRGDGDDIFTKIRRKPEMFIGLDRHGTDFSASWLTTIPNMLRVAARSNGRGLETQKDMKGATDALQQGGSCRGHRAETARTRDMLDFLAVHLGGYTKYGDPLYHKDALYTRTPASRKLQLARNLLHSLLNESTEKTMKNNVASDNIERENSRHKTLCVVSLCFRCTSFYDVERRSIEAVFMQIAVRALHLTCEVVVAGVMRFVQDEDSYAARRAGFDAWFPVEHSNITTRPTNWTGFWAHPSKRHAWQTVAQLAQKLKRLRSASVSDDEALHFFQQAHGQGSARLKRYDAILWSEQDMLILPRYPASVLLSAGRRFCKNRFAVVQPWRAHAIPKSAIHKEATVHPILSFLQLDQVSCCFLHDRSRFGFWGKSEKVEAIPVTSSSLAFLELGSSTKNKQGGIIIGLAGNNDCRKRMLYYPCWLHVTSEEYHCPCSQLILKPEAQKARLANLSLPPNGAASAFMGCRQSV